MKRSIFLTLLVSLVSLSLQAADIAGKWRGQIEGAGQETTFTLKLDGTSITGTMTNAGDKENPLTGSIDGDKISLVVASEWQGQPVQLRVTGTAEGDVMNLTIASENGEWNAPLKLKRV